MKEILPGLIHWTVQGGGQGLPLSSYYWSPRGILVDPSVPPEGLDAFRMEGGGTPEHVLLTCCASYRDAGRFAGAFECPVWCHASGVQRFRSGELVRAFQWGEELPAGVSAFEIGAGPDDAALVFPPELGAVALGATLVRELDGPVLFAPDERLGPDPEDAKTRVRATCRRLLAGHAFDHLLFTEGHPWIGGGRAALAALAGT